MNSPIETKKNYYGKMREKGKSFYVYLVLRILVILTAVRCIFEGNYESFMLCILSLVLFTLPALFQEKFKIVIPPAFEITIYLFIYAAEILGEVNAYYTAIPGWDTMLHTLNGFLAAAIGFSMIDLLNRNSKSLSLSPFYQAMMAFCFSMTIGVVWEFFEFAMDQLFNVDMQKDFIVKTIASVTLDPEKAQNVIKIPDIVRTMIETADGGRIVVEGGYLDIGILDTMKDLLVNFLGAIVFSVFGYIFVKNEQKGTGKENIAGKMKLSKAVEDEDDTPGVQPQKKTRKPQSAKLQADGTGEGRTPKKKVTKSEEGQTPKKKVTKSGEGQAPKKKAPKNEEGQAPKRKVTKSEEGQTPKRKAPKSEEGQAPKRKAPKSGEGQASEKKVKKSGEGQAQETREKAAPKKKVTKTGDAAEQSTPSSKKPAQKSGNTQSSKKPAQKSGNAASSKPKTRKPEENTKPKAQKPENEKAEDVKAEEALQESVISVQVLDETVSAETEETKTENEE